MKKRIAVLVCAVLIVGLMSGCRADKNQPVQPNIQTPQTTAPNSQPASGSDAQQQQTPSAAQSQGAVDTSDFVGEEKAKEIALSKAGISADGVHFDRVELDFDNGVWQYEVEFRKDGTEYDADINATDGTILSWDVDYAD